MFGKKKMRRLGQVIRRRGDEFTQTRHTERSYIVESRAGIPDRNLTPEYGGKPRQGA